MEPTTHEVHAAGIVSEPGHKGRRYRISERLRASAIPSQETWYANAKSWKGHGGRRYFPGSSGIPRGVSKPPSLGAAGQGYRLLEDAPGVMCVKFCKMAGPWLQGCFFVRLNGVSPSRPDFREAPRTAAVNAGRRPPQSAARSGVEGCEHGAIVGQAGPLMPPASAPVSYARANDPC
jgi:hypothetical protein